VECIRFRLRFATGTSARPNSDAPARGRLTRHGADAVGSLPLNDAQRLGRSLGIGWRHWTCPRLPDPAISQHLDVLERAGLIERIPSGRENRCRIRGAPMAGAVEWLGGYTRYWAEAFDRMERHFPESPEPEEPEP
jgi:hypothetical protein